MTLKLQTFTSGVFTDTFYVVGQNVKISSLVLTTDLI